MSIKQEKPQCCECISYAICRMYMQTTPENTSLISRFLVKVASRCKLATDYIIGYEEGRIGYYYYPHKIRKMLKMFGIDTEERFSNEVTWKSTM